MFITIEIVMKNENSWRSLDARHYNWKWWLIHNTVRCKLIFTEFRNNI